MSSSTTRLLLRPALTPAGFGALFGFTVAIEDFLFLFLHQDSGERLWSAMGRNLELLPILGRTALFSVLALVLAFAFSGIVSRSTRKPIDETLAGIAPAYVTLLVPIGLTLAAVASLTVSPVFPYGANLAVSLALEGPFDALLTAGLLLAGFARALAPWEAASLWIPRRRFFGPALVLAALALFTLATPARFYRDGVGQGNMFKYVRMADAVATAGTLDIAEADAGEATFGGFLGHLPRIAAAYVSESGKLIGNVLEALAGGELYRGERTASRANRSMFRSADGGTYYINAPGPGLLLVPAFLVDRTINRWLGTNGQVAVIVFWQLIGALLVHQVVLATTDLASRAAGVLTAFVIALSVPFLFYTYQIYPELPGGLLLLFAFRKLVLTLEPWTRDVLAGGIALATLPWLHQKYSVTAAVLGIYAAYRFVRKTPGGRRRQWMKLLPLALPLALSAYSIFLYNHALTGSLAPTATFDSAERSSFIPANALKGLLGLLLDRQNGLFVFAPIYLLALVGARAFARDHRRITTPFVLVVASYLLVIASFPYWPGAVSTMGRYILSILPLLAFPVALVVDRALTDGRLAGSALVLTAASFAYGVSFSRDLVPSYQPDLFWSRALYAEPAQYLPSFLSDGFLGSGPAHFAKALVLLILTGALVYLLRDRVEERGVAVSSDIDVDASRFARSLSVGAGGLLVAVVALGALLERWPGNTPSGASERPVYRETLTLPDGRELWVEGDHGFEGRGVWIGGGAETQFLMHASEPVNELTLYVTNGPHENELQVEEHGEAEASFRLPPDGPHEQKIRLRNPHRFVGSSPVRERFLYQFSLRSRGSFVPADEGRGDDERRLGAYVELR